MAGEARRRSAGGASIRRGELNAPLAGARRTARPTLSAPRRPGETPAGAGIARSSLLPSAATAPALFAPRVPALLALTDGTVFRGRSIGAHGRAIGEVVFNTAMTGYEEILTDPSYAGQIVTLTCPHVGNVGVNPEDTESRRIFVAGLVIRDLPALASSWRRTQDLGQFLTSGNVVGIADIDTRKLTRILREKGAQNGCIVAGAGFSEADEADAVARAKAAPSMAGLDLAKAVSCTERYDWASSTWALGVGYRPANTAKFNVIAYQSSIDPQPCRSQSRSPYPGI